MNCVHSSEITNCQSLSFFIVISSGICRVNQIFFKDLLKNSIPLQKHTKYMKWYRFMHHKIHVFGVLLAKQADVYFYTGTELQFKT